MRSLIMFRARAMNGTRYLYPDTDLIVTMNGIGAMSCEDDIPFQEKPRGHIEEVQTRLLEVSP